MFMQEEKMLFRFFRENEVGLNNEVLFVKGEVVNGEINYILGITCPNKPRNNNLFYDYNDDVVLGELICDSKVLYHIVLFSTFYNHHESLKLPINNTNELLKALLKPDRYNKLENKFEFSLFTSPTKINVHIFEEIIPTIKSKMIMEEEKMLFRFFRENNLNPTDGSLFIEGEKVDNEIIYRLCFSPSIKSTVKYYDNYYYKYNNDVVIGSLLDVRTEKLPIVLASNSYNHDESLKLPINTSDLLKLLLNKFSDIICSPPGAINDINELSDKFYYSLTYSKTNEEIIPTIKSKMIMQNQEEKTLLVKDVIRELMTHDGYFTIVKNNYNSILKFTYKNNNPEQLNNNLNYFLGNLFNVTTWITYVPYTLLEKINNKYLWVNILICDNSEIDFDDLLNFLDLNIINADYIIEDDSKLLDYFVSVKDIEYNKISVKTDEVQINKYKLFYIENCNQILVNVDGNLEFCEYFWGCSRELYLTIKYKGDNITLLSTDYENAPVNTWIDKNEIITLRPALENIGQNPYNDFQLIKTLVKNCKFNTVQSPITTKLKHFVVDEEGVFYLLGEAGDVNVGDDVLVCTKIMTIVDCKMTSSYQFTKQYYKVKTEKGDTLVGLSKHNSSQLDTHHLVKNVYKIYASTSDKILHSNTFIMESKLLSYINYLGFGVNIAVGSKINNIYSENNLNIDSIQSKESLTFIYNNMLHNCDVKGFKSPKLVLIGDNENNVCIIDTKHHLYGTEKVNHFYKGDFYLLEDQFNENCEYFIVDNPGSINHNLIFRHSYSQVDYDCISGYLVSFVKDTPSSSTRIFDRKLVKSIIGTTNKALGGKTLMNTSMIFEVLDLHSINLETLDSGLHQSYYFLNRLLEDCFVKPLNSNDDDVFVTIKTGLNGENEIKLPVVDGKVNLNKYNHVSFFIKDIIIPEGVLYLSIKSTTISKLVLPSSLISLDATQCKDLSELIIPENSKLKELTISFSLLTHLIIKQNLDRLTIIDNNKLVSLDLLGYVKNINAHNNSLETINLVGGCEELNVSHNNLTELVIPDGCVNFNAKDNKLTNLVLSNTVQAFDVSNNNLINLKTTPSVLKFIASNNKLSSLKLNKGLTNVDVDNNNLFKIKLPNSCMTMTALNNPIKGMRLGTKTTGFYISKRPEFVTMGRKVFEYLCNKDKDGKINIDFLIKLASS